MARPIVPKKMRGRILGFLHGVAVNGIVAGYTQQRIATAIDYSSAYVGFAISDLERDGFLKREFVRYREARYLLTPLVPAPITSENK